MVTVSEFRKLALSFSDVTEQPHFERTSFRANKKIVATLDEKQQIVCLMLDEIQQSVFCAFDASVIYPVPNKWGKQGATYVELKLVRKDMLRDAFTEAYKKATAKKTKPKS
ncbi:MAG: MmcQ/YjbR family DNA-binding protein [Bacteroidia bacterium]